MGGERYSLVFFSVRTWNKIPQSEVKAAAKCGIGVPSKKNMACMQSLLGPSGDEGYRVSPAPANGKVSGTGSKRKSPAASEPKAKRQRPVATPVRSGRSHAIENPTGPWGGSGGILRTFEN